MSAFDLIVRRVDLNPGSMTQHVGPVLPLVALVDCQSWSTLKLECAIRLFVYFIQTSEESLLWAVAAAAAVLGGTG